MDNLTCNKTPLYIELISANGVSCGSTGRIFMYGIIWCLFPTLSPWDTKKVWQFWGQLADNSWKAMLKVGPEQSERIIS